MLPWPCQLTGTLNIKAVGDTMMQMGLNFIFALVCAVWSHDAFLVNRRAWGWTGLFLSAANFAAGLALLLRPI